MSAFLEYELEAEFAAAATELELASGIEREIIGPDTRIAVTNTSVYPHRLICNLEYDFPGLGRWPMCSGTLIGATTVLTAGHCIANLQPVRMRVIPGRFGSQEPLSSSPVIAARVAPGFVAATPTDFAVLYLRDPLGSRVGFWSEGYQRAPGDPLGTSMAPVPTLPSGQGVLVHVSGYPADKPNGSGCTNPAQPQRRCFHSLLGSVGRSRLCGSFPFRAADRFVAASGGMLHYLDDTCPGHSGSPVWVENSAAAGGRVMVGVHIAGDDGTGVIANRAVQFTPAVLAQIRQWLATAPGGGTRPTLRRGSSGSAVVELQTRLNAWIASQAALAVLAVDGIFGPRTDAAVRAFQRQNSLLVDGIVGPLTWGALLAAPSGRISEAAYESGPSAIVQNICVSAGALAERLRQQMQQTRRRSPQHWPSTVDRIRRQGATWINRISNQLLPQLDRFTRPELDQIVGCVARVEHAIGVGTAPFRRLKSAAQQRLAGPVRTL
jgi:V8-like Glu-specific endopeptidase